MSEKLLTLDIEVTQEVKEKIEKAADFLNMSVSDFVVGCAIKEAAYVLDNTEIIKLNAEESSQFIELLENPPEPNDALKRLFKSCRNIKDIDSDL